MSSLLTSDNLSTGNERLSYLTVKSKLINFFFMRGYTKLRYEPLWATMSHYEPLWATMSHYEPLWATRLTKSHYESLWVIMTQNIDTMTQLSIEYNVITQKKTKKSPFTYLILSQNYLIWSQNVKMLCLKRNFALVCIRGC